MLAVSTYETSLPVSDFSLPLFGSITPHQTHLFMNTPLHLFLQGGLGTPSAFASLQRIIELPP